MSTPPAPTSRWHATRTGRLIVLALVLLLGACTWGVAQDIAADELAQRLSFEPVQMQPDQMRCMWRGISMRNTSDVPVTIDGWSMNDYPIPRMTIQPGETITFWGGTGTDDAANRYTDQPDGIWQQTAITRPPRAPLLDRTPVSLVSVICDLGFP